MTVGSDLDAALAEKPDVVMMLRIQSERMHAAFFPHEREYARQWGLDDERFARLAPDTMVMHPGPMNRGLEISAAAADSARSVILEQVTNGVSIRMAVLVPGARGVERGPAHDASSSPGATLPDGTTTDLLVDDGVDRRARRRAVRAEAPRCIDADGLQALPGLVDLHTHLREPGFEQSETVLTGSRAAAAGGFTAVFAMANTSPVRRHRGRRRAGRVARRRSTAT